MSHHLSPSYGDPLAPVVMAVLIEPPNIVSDIGACGGTESQDLGRSEELSPIGETWLGGPFLKGLCDHSAGSLDFVPLEVVANAGYVGRWGVDLRYCGGSGHVVGLPWAPSHDTAGVTAAGYDAPK